MKVICGDANPGGNIAMTSKGGCGKELELIDAYRCTGCGVHFHLDCIYKHFEEEENHDVARNMLRTIYDTTLESSEIKIGARRLIQKLCKQGLSRQKKNRRASLRQGDYTASLRYFDPERGKLIFEDVCIYASTIEEAKSMVEGNPLGYERMEVLKLVKN